jgi:hypothetical protein
MAQSALTVTTPNPSPPTNLASIGATPPLDVLQAAVDDGCTLGGPSPITGAVNPGTPTVFAAKTAAAGSGTSVDNEGKGSETVVTATSANPGPVGQLTTFSCLGSFTGVANPTTGVSTSPNATHASSMSPITNPALVSIAPATLAAALTGTQVITATGTNFKPGCRIWHDGFEQDTTYTNATTISATVKKRTSAGVAPVVVKLGGVQMGVVANFTWT